MNDEPEIGAWDALISLAVMLLLIGLLVLFS